MSPSGLPTLAPPTAPPKSPTDPMPRDVVSGRVTGLTDSCTEVTTDDGAVWSLSGDTDAKLAIGDTVSVKVSPLADGEEPCGTGLSARIVSVRLVG